MKNRYQIKCNGKWFYTYAYSKSQAYLFIKHRVSKGDKGQYKPYKSYQGR